MTNIFESYGFDPYLFPFFGQMEFTVNLTP